MKTQAETAPAPSPAGKPGWSRRVIRSLKSIRFAIILMAVIAAASLVGTLVVQEPYDSNMAISMAAARYGPRLGALVVFLGLNQLYGAWWFLGLLGLLALSVAVCTFSGARFSLRKICTLIAHASILLIVAGALLRGVAGVDGTAIIAKGQTTDVLHVPGVVRVDYKYVGPRGEQQVRKESHVLSVSEPAFLNNANVAADSIVVTDAGGAVTYKPDVDYDIGQTENQTAIRYLQTSAIGAVPLGFHLRLDEFLIRYYEGTGESLEVRLGDAGPARSIPVEVGQVVPLTPDGASKLEVLRRVLDFKMEENGQINSAPDQPPDNPAIQVRLTGPAGETKRWVFAIHPEFEGHAAGASDVHLRYVFSPPAVKSFESHVTVLDEKGAEVRNAVILVNSPLKVGRYTFYQESYDEKTLATVLEVTRDPGVPLVFAGFILLPIGIALAFYVKPLLNRKGRGDV